FRVNRRGSPSGQPWLTRRGTCVLVLRLPLPILPPRARGARGSGGARMPNVVRWVLAAVLVLLVLGPPLALYRFQYFHAKRFREVTPGRVYRSGQMTAAGF